jgi:diguanylate cyclase (GGDEF)-like protein
MVISLNELPNRESLERDLSAQLKNGRTVSAVFVDLDGFKQVNDQHGHDEGDRCLVEVATAMSKAIEGKGRLYRVGGGDEFCIMLSNSPGFDATADAEQIRLSIDRLNPFGGITKVTASIGVATSCSKLTDAKALIAAADDVMYISKWTTKNCVTTWPPSDAARNRADLAKLSHRVGTLQTQIAAQNKKDVDEKQRKQRIVEELAKFLQQGREIRDKLEFNNFSVQEVSGWKQRVAHYLTENLGEPFAVRFRNSSHQIPPYPPNMVPAMRVPWMELTQCMMMLNDFMAEHRS